MNKIEYSESFIKKAQELLRRLTSENKLEVPYGPPFSKFSVVAGPTEKQIVAVLEVPDDLKDSVQEAYVVTE